MLKKIFFFFNVVFQKIKIHINFKKFTYIHCGLEMASKARNINYTNFSNYFLVFKKGHLIA